MTSIPFRAWFVGLGLVGVAAGLAAAGLLWLVLTRPVAVAVALAGGL